MKKTQMTWAMTLLVCALLSTVVQCGPPQPGDTQTATESASARPEYQTAPASATPAGERLVETPTTAARASEIANPTTEPVPSDILPTLTSSPAPPPTPLPSFGVEIKKASGEPQLALAQAAGVYWLRKNGLKWANVEPIPGARRWEAVTDLEIELEAAHNAGLQTILILRRTPKWAQMVPGHFCGPVAADALDELAQFMADAVARYKDPPYAVKYWEIWNEPDVDPALVKSDSVFGCWGDRKDEYYGGRYYAEMLQAIYPAMKAVDPEAQVLIGGLLLDRDPAEDEHDNPPGRFLEGILEGGGGDFFDIVGFHAYTHYYSELGDWEKWPSGWAARGGSVEGKVALMRETLNNYGYDKPLMLTEAGLVCSECPSPPPGAFLEAQAAYVPRLYVRNMALGLEATIWYTLDGPGWRQAGLLNEEQQPRPAYRALEAMTSLLEGATFVRALSDFSGLTGYVLEEVEGGSEIWVLWSPDGAPVPIPIPPGLREAHDLYGAPLEPEDDTLEIGFSPVYLVVSP